MAFKEQSFPITCNIWNYNHNDFVEAPPPGPASQEDIPCQLSQPLALIVPPFPALPAGGRPAPLVFIKLPTGTPAGDGWVDNAVSARAYRDLIEVPADSGNFYGVLSRCTVGQGYINEHVRCLCLRLTYPNPET